MTAALAGEIWGHRGFLWEGSVGRGAAPYVRDQRVSSLELLIIQGLSCATVAAYPQRQKRYTRKCKGTKAFVLCQPKDELWPYWGQEWGGCELEEKKPYKMKPWHHPFTSFTVFQLMIRHVSSTSLMDSRMKMGPIGRQFSPPVR